MTTTAVRYGIRATFPRPVEVVNPEGRIHRVALDEQGHALLCNCPGNVYTGRCKHLGLVAERLGEDGLALPVGGRLLIRPGIGMVEESRPDPFARAGRCRRIPPRVRRGSDDADIEYDPIDDVEREERRDERRLAALDEDEAHRAANGPVTPPRSITGAITLNDDNAVSRQGC